MSHSYGNGNSSGNSYLNRKRMDDDMPSYYYDKYDNKFEKYGNHSNPRYNNSMGYNYSKPPPKINNYYSNNSRYYNNYYNRQKPFYSNVGYSNGLSQKSHFIPTWDIPMVFPKNVIIVNLTKKFQLQVPLRVSVIYPIVICHLHLLYPFLQGKVQNHLKHLKQLHQR